MPFPALQEYVASLSHSLDQPFRAKNKYFETLKVEGTRASDQTEGN